MAYVYQDERNCKWCISYTDAQGRRKREKVAETKTVAELVLRKTLDKVAIEKASGRAIAQPKSFSELADEYVKHIESYKTPSSARRDRGIAEKFKTIFANKMLSEISVRDVETYQANRANQVEKATINRELECLKYMFNKAIEWSYTTENPVKKVKFFKVENTIVRYLTDLERKRLLAYCSEPLRSVIITVLNTGLRKSELLNLTWADVDMENRVIRVKNTKGHKTRYIPLNSELYPVFENLAKIRHINSPYVFYRENGSAFLPSTIRKPFEQALKLAGITDFTFHCLRHDFGSHLAMQGVPLRSIQELLGHSSYEMTLRYAHLSPSHLEDAVEKLVAKKDAFAGKVGTRLAQRKSYNDYKKAGNL